MKPRAVIVDLDGTMCDIAHRRHHVEVPKGQKKNWPAFFAGIDEDKPNKWCDALVCGLWKEGVRIIFVSGRGEEFREVTQEWLSKHVYVEAPLFMRPQGDRRDDHVVKEEIYRNNIEPDYDVLFCVDDRQQVVDMWRRIGLVCLQCDKGDF